MSALIIGQIVGRTLGGVFGHTRLAHIFIVFGIVSGRVRRPHARGNILPRRRRRGRCMIFYGAARRFADFFVGLLGVLPIAVSTGLEAAGRAPARGRARSTSTEHADTTVGDVCTRHRDVEGLFVFGGLAYSRRH